jgi:hypothetical protein
MGTADSSTSPTKKTRRSMSKGSHMIRRPILCPICDSIVGEKIIGEKYLRRIGGICANPICARLRQQIEATHYRGREWRAVPAPRRALALASATTTINAKPLSDPRLRSPAHRYTWNDRAAGR